MFIDGVDHEWCWRAWHQAKLRSFIVEDALISHQLGEGDRRIAYKEIAIASSFRVYYQFRNYLWLSSKLCPVFLEEKAFDEVFCEIFLFPFVCISKMGVYEKYFKGSL